MAANRRDPALPVNLTGVTSGGGEASEAAGAPGAEDCAGGGACAGQTRGGRGLVHFAAQRRHIFNVIHLPFHSRAEPSLLKLSSSIIALNLLRLASLLSRYHILRITSYPMKNQKRTSI